MSTPILRPAATSSKPAIEQCPTCTYGRCLPGTNCKACLDAHQQSKEARARDRRRELIGRQAALIECLPAELIELQVEIALQAQGGSA